MSSLSSFPSSSSRPWPSARRRTRLVLSHRGRRSVPCAGSVPSLSSNPRTCCGVVGSQTGQPAGLEAECQHPAGGSKRRPARRCGETSLGGQPAMGRWASNSQRVDGYHCGRHDGPLTRGKRHRRSGLLHLRAHLRAHHMAATLAPERRARLGPRRLGRRADGCLGNVLRRRSAGYCGTPSCTSPGACEVGSACGAGSPSRRAPTCRRS